MWEQVQPSMGKLYHNWMIRWSYYSGKVVQLSSELISTLKNHMQAIVILLMQSPLLLYHTPRCSSHHWVVPHLHLCIAWGPGHCADPLCPCPPPLDLLSSKLSKWFQDPLLGVVSHSSHSHPHCLSPRPQHPLVASTLPHHLLRACTRAASAMLMLQARLLLPSTMLWYLSTSPAVLR